MDNEMVMVYRVQNADGVGPYSGNVTSVIDSEYWTVLDNHVEPKRDSFDEDVRIEEVCAFEDFEQAREWFNEIMINLLSLDPDNDWFFAAYEINSSKVRFGTYQVLAVADEMEFVDAVPVKNLYN